MDVYVYYDVPVARQQAAREAVGRLHAALANDGVACRLLRRPESRADGSQTWMEVYADVDAPFVERLAAAAAAAGVTASTGPRHVERFVPLHRCA